MKLRVIRIKDEIYERPVVILVGDRKLAKRWLKRHDYGEEFFEGGTLGSGRTWRIKRDVIVWVQGFRKNAEDIARLAHELNHAAYFVMDYVGIRYKDESEEAFVYYFDFLMSQALKKLLKERK